MKSILYKALLLFCLFSIEGKTQNLVHNFEFNGNLNDTRPSGAALTTYNTATTNFGTNPNSWTWTQPTSPGGGLELLTNQLANPESYSLGFRISFQDTGNADGTTKSYKKILSFKGATDDNGLYFNHRNLQFFPFGANASVTYLPNVFYDFVLTRSAAKEIKVYIVEANGTVTQVYSQSDPNNDAVPQLISGKYEFRFFINDNVGAENTQGGTVRSIRLWDSPLSAGDIAAALSSVTTGEALNVSATATQLTGEVNPQGNTASFDFEYGTTTAYGQTIAATPPSGSSSSAIAITANLTGLQTGTTYHYRLKSTVGGNSVYGSDKTFTTIGAGGVAGANLWLKANTGATNSGNDLTAWTDQTGTNTFTKTGAIDLNAIDINFNPSVSINSTNAANELPTNRLTGNTSIEVVEAFAVFKWDGSDPSNSGTLIGGIEPGSSGSFGRAIFGGYSNYPAFCYVSDGFYWKSYPTNSLFGERYFLNNVNLLDATLLSRIDGQTVTPGSLLGDFRKVNFTPIIGGTNNTTSSNAWPHFRGQVAEIITYPTGLTTTDRKKVESYLAIKYGISLGNNVGAAIYTNSAGLSIYASGTYKYDVFGIGKDDASGLNQSSSNSINTGSGDGTGQSGKGNIVLSNPSSLDDTDFLIIGHDNGSLTEQSTDLPAPYTSYGSRTGREWKNKKTGDVGTLNMSFNTLGLTTTGTTASDFALLIDEDGNGDFSNGTITEIAPTAYSGNLLEFNGISLTDGAVFTILTSKGPTVWNGTSWSLGTPTATKDAVIDGDFTLTASELITKNLTVNTTKNLVINSGKALNIKGNLVNNGTIVFKSDATGSGVFDSYTGTAITGTGSVQVERYIPARRAFRFLTSAVTTSASINTNWQEAGASLSGLGTHITGSGGGFDVSTTNNPSMFTFDAGNWIAVANTNATNLTAGAAYRLMVRGDRTISLATNTPTPTNTILRATGNLHTGNYIPNLNTAADSFSLIGNPYQAPINIKNVLLNAINMNNNVVYYWDPTLNTRGGYVTRDLGAGTNDVTSNFNEFLQPGQAVFVVKDATANAPTLTITEANKAVANASAGVFKTKSNKASVTNSYLQVELNSPSVNATLDGALILFDANFDSNLTYDDHKKLGNLDEQMGIKLQNQLLAIAKQSIPNEADELALETTNYRQTNYEYRFALKNYSGPTPYLFDNVEQSYTPIADGTTKLFTVDSQVATTAASDRFKIVFSNKTLGINKDISNSLLTMYPNPLKANSKNEFVITNVSTKSIVKLHNTLGQEIKAKTYYQDGNLIVRPTTNLSSGIYLVNVSQEDKSSTLKLIVE